MRTRGFLVLLAASVGLGACSPPPSERPIPTPAACRDPVYRELSAQHPDSLSDRAWDRLQQLADDCRAERARQLDAREVRSDPGLHAAAWIWMPAMMLVGGMMWLLTGAT